MNKRLKKPTVYKEMTFSGGVNRPSTKQDMRRVVQSSPKLLNDFSYKTRFILLVLRMWKLVCLGVCYSTSRHARLR